MLKHLFCSSNDSSEEGRTELANRETRLVKWCALLVLALASAWPLTLNLVDPDLWGHVRYAQDWLTAGELPRTATHTFTAEGHAWINHENLAELALAGCYEWFGVDGLLLAKCLMGMGIVLSMVWVAGLHQVHQLVSWSLMLVVTANLEAFFPLRPQLLSFALCAVALVVLDRAFADWHPQRRVRLKLLWLVPFVFAVWVNSHGGFVAGLAIVGGYLAGRILELLLDREHFRGVIITHFTAVGVACLTATLLNPYGLDLLRWLSFSVRQPRPEITEWLPPRPGDAVFMQWITLLAVIAFSLLATKRRRDWVQLVVLLLVIWQAALHLRHIAFVALLCGYWIPPHLQSALGRLLPTGRSRPSLVILSPAVRALAVVTLLVAIALQSFALDERLRSLPVERNRFPVDAIQYMADRQLEGKLVVSFNWAQYAIAALAPKIEVAFDGRFYTCYPPEVVDMHFDFLLGQAGGRRNRQPESGPIDGARVLNYGNPDLVLIDRLYENPVNIMKAQLAEEHPKWVLLFRDRVAELWGRRQRYDDPTSPDYLPPNLRVQDPRPRLGSVSWPALPLPLPKEYAVGEQAKPRLANAQL